MSKSSCPRCGAVSRNNAAFCSQCGSSLAVPFPDMKPAGTPPPPAKKPASCCPATGRGGRAVLIFMLLAAGMLFGLMRTQAKRCQAERRIRLESAPSKSSPGTPGGGWMSPFQTDGACTDSDHTKAKASAPNKLSPRPKPDRGLKPNVRQEVGEPSFVTPGEPES